MGLGLREVTYLAVAVRILTAVVVGGLIGLERGMKNRPAGLRTYMLVCTGACLIMLTNQYIYQTFHTGDPIQYASIDTSYWQEHFLAFGRLPRP